MTMSDRLPETPGVRQKEERAKAHCGSLVVLLSGPELNAGGGACLVRSASVTRSFAADSGEPVALGRGAGGLLAGMRRRGGPA